MGIEKKISDCFQFVRNGLSIKQESGAGGLPITRIETIWNSEIDNKRFGYANISSLEEGKHINYIMEAGDILMTHINSPKHLGKAAIYQGVPEILIHGMNLLCLRPKMSVICSKYANYFFKSNQFKSILVKISNQSVNQASFSVGKLKNLPIPLPPLATQKRIASILDDAQALKQKTEKLLVEYDALAQSIFLDMFGDPVTNPKGWEFKILNNLVTKLGDGLHGTPNFSDEGDYYFVNGNNLNHGKIVLDNKTKKVSKEEYEKYKKELNTNTVFVSINGSIGKIAFYNNEPIMLGKSACYFNLKQGLINKIFLYYVIISPYFFRYAKSQATGSTIKNVSLKTMRNFPIPYPPLELQNKFAEKIALIEQQKAIAKQELKESEDLFNGLLQKAFKGELG